MAQEQEVAEERAASPQCTWRRPAKGGMPKFMNNPVSMFHTRLQNRLVR